MKKIIIGSICALITTSALAENLINTQTNSWKNVPITVDDTNHTYSVSKGYLMPEGDYYYAYSGFRCLDNKLEKAGVDPVVYNDANSKEHAIYCYPEK